MTSKRAQLVLMALLPLLASDVLAQKVKLKRGDLFPNFKATDAISGKQITLEQFRGRVVLIDFWATWCGPCIAELPNVKKAYAKHHKDGLEIISISLDNRPKACRDYVAKHKLDWFHVIEGGGWNTRLAKKYGISSIPAMFLLDPDGKILSVRARGSALHAALNEGLAKVDTSKLKPLKLEKATDDAVSKKQNTAREMATRRLGRGRKLLKADQVEEGYFILKDVVTRYPDTDAAKAAKKEIEYLLENEEVRRELEIAEARRARDEYEKQANNKLQMARSFKDAKQYDKARAQYDEIIKTYAKSWAAEKAREERDALPKE